MAFTNDEVLAGLAELITDETGINASEVALEKSFTDDLDIDSISMMTIVVNAEEKFGVTIPDDLSVLSLLTSLEYRSACNPPLTVVSTPANKLGQLGVQTLLRRLDGDPPSEPVLRVGVLVPGESTGQAPARTPVRRLGAPTPSTPR